MEVEEVNVTNMTFMETPQDMKLNKNETKQLNIDCNPKMPMNRLRGHQEMKL